MRHLFFLQIWRDAPDGRTFDIDIFRKSDELYRILGCVRINVCLHMEMRQLILDQIVQCFIFIFRLECRWQHFYFSVIWNVS